MASVPTYAMRVEGPGAPLPLTAKTRAGTVTEEPRSALSRLGMESPYSTKPVCAFPLTPWSCTAHVRLRRCLARQGREGLRRALGLAPIHRAAPNFPDDPAGAEVWPCGCRYLGLVAAAFGLGSEEHTS